MDDQTKALLDAGWWADALIQRAQLDREANERREAANVLSTIPHVVHSYDHTLTEWESAWIRARIVDRLAALQDAHAKGIETLAIEDKEHVRAELERRVDPRVLHSSDPEHKDEVKRHRKTIAGELGQKKNDAHKAIEDAERFRGVELDDVHTLLAHDVQTQIRERHPAPEAPEGVELAPAESIEAAVEQLERREPEQNARRACPGCGIVRDRLFQYEEGLSLCEPCCEKRDRVLEQMLEEASKGQQTE